MGVLATNTNAQLKLSRDIEPRSSGIGASTKLGETLATALPPAKLTPDVLREVDYIVVIVNSVPITRNEVLIKQSRLLAQWRAQGVRPPQPSELFKMVLDRLVDERIMQQQAKERGIRVNDDQVQEAMANVARQNQLPSTAALQAKYEADGGNWSQYADEIRNELLMLQFREREMENRIRISETEIDQALGALKMQASKTEDIQLAQILIALPDDATVAQTAAAKAKAAQLSTQAKGGADFAKLARENSDAADKVGGGNMGLRPAERYPSLFVDAIKNLKVGAALQSVSEPIQSGAGFHVLKLLERQSHNVMTVTQWRVRHILLPVSKDLNEAQALGRLRALKNQIELGQTSFAAAAKDHSTDGSSAQGGDLGWAGPGLFVPEFERVVTSSAVGRMAEPFISRFGAHLLEVVDRKDVALSERDQRAQIREQLREKKSEEAYALWLVDIRARAFIEYRNQSGTN